MRQTLRYIISGIVLIGLILGVYFLFFAPKQDLTMYEKTMIILDYKQKLNSVDSMDNLYSSNGYGENYSNPFDSSKHGEIISIRKKLFGEADDKMALTELNGSEYNGYIYCYSKYDKVLQDYIQLYSTYLKNASGSNKNAQDALLDKMNEYKNNYMELDTIIESIMKVQKTYTVEDGQTDNALSNADLTNHYRNLKAKYREAINSQAELLIQMRSYVVNFTFTDNFADSAYTSLHDCMAFSIGSAFKNAAEAENGYLVDATAVINKCIAFEDGDGVFSSVVTKEVFIESYRNLYYNYYDGLINIFSLSHQIKNEVVNGNSFVNANIVVEYQQSVHNLLSIICF